MTQHPEQQRASSHLFSDISRLRCGRNRGSGIGRTSFARLSVRSPARSGVRSWHLEPLRPPAHRYGTWERGPRASLLAMVRPLWTPAILIRGGGGSGREGGPPGRSTRCQAGRSRMARLRVAPRVSPRGSTSSVLVVPVAGAVTGPPLQGVPRVEGPTEDPVGKGAGGRKRGKGQ